MSATEAETLVRGIEPRGAALTACPSEGKGERGLQHDTLTRVFLMVTALATSVALAGFAVEVLIQLAWKYG